MITPDEVVQLALTIAKNFDEQMLPILADALEEAGMPFGITELEIKHLRTNHDHSELGPCYVVNGILRLNGYQEVDDNGIVRF